MHCLVIGGAGILRPASLALLREGHSLTATALTHASIESLARAAGGLRGDVRGIAGDYEHPGALRRGLAGAVAEQGPFDLAIVYTAGRAPCARRVIAEQRPASVIDVLTSGHAAPGLGPDHRRLHALQGRDHSVRLLLGWAIAGVEVRWHTADEISAAALAARAAADASELVLGTLRPWGDRPAR